MAITVQIKAASVDANGINLTYDTANDAVPAAGTLRCSGTYATTMTAAQIKTAINQAVTLLWQAVVNGSWTV